MAKNFLTSSYDLSDEDYIDNIITSYSPSHTLCCSPSPRLRLSTNNNSEFEFQNPSSFDPIAEEPTLIPADDLFHKGRLLPLYLRQSGQETLHGPQNLNKHVFEDNNDLYYSITFVTTCSEDQKFDDVPPSPDDSDDEIFFEWSAHELNSIIGKKPTSKNKKSWINKVKFGLGCMMRAPMRYYLKSLFLCFDESCGVKKGALSGRSLATLMNNEVEIKEVIEGCAKSFPSVTNRCSSTTSSCYSSAFSSCSFDAKATSFKSSSDDDEEDDDDMEGSVDAAVAYCKKSMRIFSSSLDKEYENMFV